MDANIDKDLKELMSLTKTTASDNLKYRIMQQLETEVALKQRVVPPKKWNAGNIFSMLGVMYALVFGIAAALYFTYGKVMLENTVVQGSLFLIVSVSSFFILISAFDDRRMQKKHKA